MRDSSLVLKVLVLSGLLTSVFAASAHAQEKLSAEEFQARVQGKLPELERFKADVLAAEAKVAEAQALPSMSLSYERDEVFTGGDAVALTNAVSVGWSLDISGRRGHYIKSAELEAQAVAQGADFAKRLVTIEALRIYYMAAFARLKVESLQASRAPLSTLMDRLKNRVGQGDASGYDLARFELQLAEHDDSLADANTELAVAQAELSALLGDPKKEFVAASELPLPAIPKKSGNPGGATRSDMLATQQEEQSGRALAKAASRWWIPTLDLSLGYLNTDFGPGTGPGADVAHGYTGMISASIPIFSKGESDRKHGEAVIRRAQAERKILQRQISVQVKTAQTRLLARVEQTQRFRQRQLVKVAEFAKKTETAYQGGEASALDLGDAYGKASAAELRFIELRYQCRLAQLALWSATGELGKEVSK